MSPDMCPAHENEHRAAFLSARNKRVADSRWAKVLAHERQVLPKDSGSLIMKSALCGFLAGDGHVARRIEHLKTGREVIHHDLSFFPDDIEMVNVFCGFLQHLYSKRPSIRKQGKMFELYLNSKTVVDDILATSMFGLYSWRVPDHLFVVPGSREAWLRAFFSAEAYVGVDSIRVQTVNFQGMQGVSTALDEIGIAHKMYRYCPKKNNHSPVCILVILRKDARREFLENIGFWHGRKEVALKKALTL